MTEINRQLEVKIQERLGKLGISLTDQEGYFYLSEVLYVILCDSGIETIEEAQQIVAKKNNIPLYQVQQKIAELLNMANEEALKEFYNSDNYNLKLVYENIQLIADDIVERG